MRPRSSWITIVSDETPPQETSATAALPDAPAPRKKASYIGAPAVFLLDTACRQINEAYGYCDHAQIYHVGSSLSRADWRDVDLRMMMSDADFRREFPDAHDDGAWELDPKWSLLTTAISVHLSRITGLPIDFQFQPMTFANKHHRGPRNAMGLRMIPRSKREDNDTGT